LKQTHLIGGHLRAADSQAFFSGSDLSVRNGL
jgi:hypothetical protein